MLCFNSIEATARLHSASFRVMKHREALLDVEEQSLAVIATRSCPRRLKGCEPLPCEPLHRPGPGRCTIDRLLNESRLTIELF